MSKLSALAISLAIADSTFRTQEYTKNAHAGTTTPVHMDTKLRYIEATEELEEALIKEYTALHVYGQVLRGKVADIQSKIMLQQQQLVNSQQQISYGQIMNQYPHIDYQMIANITNDIRLVEQAMCYLLAIVDMDLNDQSSLLDLRTDGSPSEYQTAFNLAYPNHHFNPYAQPMPTPVYANPLKNKGWDPVNKSDESTDE